jgi:hypothetical protein
MDHFPLSGSAGRNPANLSTPGVKPLTFSFAVLFKWLHISKIIQNNIYIGLAYILLELKQKLLKDHDWTSKSLIQSPFDAEMDNEKWVRLR